MGSEKTVEVENLGPIPKAAVTLSSPGVTVLTAPNGAGKSIFLDAAAKLARGKGKVPLRDHARRGKVAGFGARLTIGQSTRHAGSFEVETLEGRFDLAELVDPKLKSPEAADRRRIKALVGLTGVEADTRLFTDRDDFPDFAEVVRLADSADLVELAGAVRRDYEQAARQQEGVCEKSYAAARALQIACDGLDLDVESDPERLQNAYDAARDVLSRLSAQKDTAEQLHREAEAAGEQLAAEERRYGGPSAAEADQLVHDAEDECQRQLRSVESLEADLAAARGELASARQQAEHAAAALRDAEQHEQFVRAAQEIVDKVVDVPCPSSDEIEAAAAAVEAAQVAIREGTRVSDAKTKLAAAARYRQAGAAARKQSLLYREAAKLTDEVLSDAIHCDLLAVESTGGTARLVVEHDKRGPGVPYHELSEGERWRIAIDIGAHQVGRGGLLVIPQEAWESLDVFTRPVIHERAIERDVYIITAEATRDAADGDNLVARGYEKPAK